MTNSTPDARSGPRGGSGSLREDRSDPNKATLLYILRLLNQAEDEFEDDAEKGLEQDELEYRTQNYWAVKSGDAKLAVILELLLDNKMVEHTDGGPYSWIRKKQIQGLYRITDSGKTHLLKNIVEDGRIE